MPADIFGEGGRGRSTSGSREGGPMGRTRALLQIPTDSSQVGPPSFQRKGSHHPPQVKYSALRGSAAAGGPSGVGPLLLPVGLSSFPRSSIQFGEKR